MKREEEKREMVDKDKSELMVYNSRVHCKELFKEVLKFHKNDGFDNFEHISFFIKKKFSSKKFQYAKKVVPQRNIIECTKYEKAQLFESTKKSKKKDIEFSNGLLEDIPNNFRMLEWAGISFNSTENYKLTLSIKKLFNETKALWIRFFGKIFGRNSDYYILFGSLPSYQKTSNPSIEKLGEEGLNRYTFWVAGSTLEEWIELPEISPEQMRASRLFKYFLTGDLYSEVSNSFCYFPGYEIHLLKCQVLRILHGSFIVPVGFHRVKPVDAEGMDGKLTEWDPEFVVPPIEEMNVPEKWVHEFANILLAGRIIHQKLESDELMNELLEKDKYIERLFPIANDEPFGENRPSWNFRIMGDNQQYAQFAPKEGQTNYSCLVVRSLRWPGSLTCFKGGEFVHIYIGDGIKYGGTVFYPTQPSLVNSDPEGAYEHFEPNPKDEPELIEEDTDKEDEGDMEMV